MSLRVKLLLLSLITLILPWAGCQYAREMESALRAGEKQSLAAVARVMADSLQGRADLLYRRHPGARLARRRLRSRARHLSAARRSSTAIATTGPTCPLPRRHSLHGKDALSVLSGVHERMLYLLLEVRDNRVIFDAPASNPLDTSKAGDRIWLAFQDSRGRRTAGLHRGQRHGARAGASHRNPRARRARHRD